MANEFIARKGLIVSGSTVVTDAVTASFFKGDGSNLTNITTTSASYAATSSNLFGGTANYIPLWTSATAQSSSNIYQSGSSVSIGTTSATSSATLTIDGSQPTLIRLLRNGAATNQNTAIQFQQSASFWMAGAGLDDSFSVSRGNLNVGGASLFKINSVGGITSSGDATIAGVTVGRGGGSSISNVAVGGNALNVNTTGTINVAVGYNALSANTLGSYNVAVGYAALQSNTTATNNTAIGYAAGLSITSGSENIAIGNQALYSNQTGQRIIAIGNLALYSSTVQENVAVGYVAGRYITTGTYNTLIGNYAGENNIVGSSNAALGQSALQNANTSYNTAVGSYSLYNLVSANGFTTAVGATAGYYITSGSHNTILGVFDGNQDGIDIRTANYNIVITDGNSKVRLYYDGTSNYWAFRTGAFNLTSTEKMRITDAGNVGIGTTSPGALLHVQGTISSSTLTTSNDITVTGVRVGLGGGAVVTNTAVGAGALVNNTTGGYNIAIGYQAGNAITGNMNHNTIVGTQAGVSLNTAGASGNTLIGSTAGYSLTTPAGNTFIGFNPTVGAGSGYYVTTGAKNTIVGGYTGNGDGIDIRTANNNIVLSDGDGNARLYYDGASNFWAFRNDGSERVRITSAGRMGINTTLPSASLEVYMPSNPGGTPGAKITMAGGGLGTGQDAIGLDVAITVAPNSDTIYGIRSIQTHGGTGQLAYAGYFKAMRGNSYAYSAAVYAEITGSAETNFYGDVYGVYAYANNSTSGTTGNMWALAGDTSNTSNAIALRLFDAYTTAATKTLAQFYRAGVNVGNITTNLTATTYNTSPSSGIIGIDATTIAINTNSSERVRINSSGNVGIGTTAPTRTLTVNGSTNITGSLDVTGAFTAQTKSFKISHQTIPDKSLVYGVLEGPEHAVYVRGKLKNTNTIKLPDEWDWLVDPDSITVQLTPIGTHQKLFVKHIMNGVIFIDTDNILSSNIECYYLVHATRKDVPILETVV